jgi:hypothetical protein
MNSVISVFRADETGVPSLEVVRLLNRMIKERRFNVHPNVLTCLLHLRLKTELGVRASEAKVEREEIKREKVKQGKKSKGQGAVSTHISKKAKKALKERKEIEKEMKEAEASVDKEERTSNVSRDSFLPLQIDNYPAKRNIEAPVCVVLPYSEEPGANPAAPGCSAGHFKICASCQRRLFQGPDARTQGPGYACATPCRR